MTIEVFVFLCIGAFAGLFAGMLGLGGGIVVVPSLFFVFGWFNFPENTLAQLAVGTSLATMIFTSLSSFLTHGKSGYIDFSIFKKIVPGLLVGIALGSIIALSLPTNILKLVFAGFLLLVGCQMFFYKPVAYTESKKTFKLKQPLIAGSIFGTISSLLGIGVGSTFVPYLNFHNVPFKKAVGTSSAVTLLTSIWGTSCYLLNGLFLQKSMSSVSVVYWPAVFSIAGSSVIFAFLGAKISHRISSIILKKIFSIFIVFVALILFFMH